MFTCLTLRVNSCSACWVAHVDRRRAAVPHGQRQPPLHDRLRGRFLFRVFVCEHCNFTSCSLCP
jgi:hypothetical protein